VCPSLIIIAVMKLVIMQILKDLKLCHSKYFMGTIPINSFNLTISLEVHTVPILTDEKRG
jgi:hypothetical protein